MSEPCRFSYADSLFTPFDILEVMEIPGFITYYIFIAALTIGILLLGLLLWHARMISMGVTSLERFLNQEYARQCHEQGYLFVNPYDFGFLGNWKRFLGVSTIGQFCTRVLWPSRHKPEGNGVTWDGYNVNTNLLLYRPDLASATRPIAFPPGLYPNDSTNRFSTNRFRPVVPPWETQLRPNRPSAVYQPPTPSVASNNSETTSMQAKKNH